MYFIAPFSPVSSFFSIPLLCNLTHQHTYMRKFLCLIISISLFHVLAVAQNIEFNHITPDEGLSQISVNSLYADRDGVIWIATRVGLNSYDGNSIQVYQNRPNDPNSLFSNNVIHITGNGRDKLYLLCSEGVAQLDLPSRQFKTLKYSNVIGAICYHDKLIFSEGNQVKTLDSDNGKPRLLVSLPTQHYITSLTVDSRQRLWIGTQSHGVYCLDGGRLTHPIIAGRITQIYEDSKKRLWIGSWDHGMWLVGRDGSIRKYGADSFLVSKFVRTFCEDNLGDIWIGTYLGLMRFNPESGSTQTFTAGPLENSLSNSSVWSIIKDRQGTLWIGSYFGGVNYFNPAYEIYTHYRMTGDPATGLSSQIVGRMTEDAQGNLWICTEGGGLNVYNPHTRRFQWYGFPGNMISQNNLKCIYFDKSRNAVWVGTHLGGLDRIDLTTHRGRFYKHQPGNPRSLPSDIVRDIEAYGKQLIIATQEGVVSMDPETENFTRLLPKERLRMVQSLCIDRHEQLWIATEASGVYRYDLRRHTYTHYLHSSKQGAISGNNVNNVNMDKAGRVWLSMASDGIDLFVEGENRFVNYGTAQGLLGGCVYAMEPSSLNDQNLLLITNRGFSVFDMKNKAFRNFNKDNGFPLATVNENALYVTKTGVVYLGGVRGMVSFRERDLYRRTMPYTIGFSRLFVNGREVMPGDDSHILRNSLRYTDEIELNHKQSLLSIEFYTSNYIRENDAPLRYRLLGSSAQWLPIRPGQHSIDFSGLSSGHYTLEVNSSRADIAMARLKIRILPPWYLSWWAYLIYLVAVVVLVRWLIREYRNRIRLAESLKYEQQHVKDVEERNQSKIRFFTNVSHEIRTPLTVIIGLAESLLQGRSVTSDIYNKVLSIYRNSDQLRELITELLDFRKQEMALPTIHVQSHPWAAFVQNICLLFKEYAVSKDISLQVKAETAVEVWFDSRQMRKVVNNLVSNALKHTPQGGVVTVSIGSDSMWATLSVSDTGKGIAPGDLPLVFDRFYQGKEIESLSDMGTGIGLNLTRTIVNQHHGEISVASVVGEGTTFTVTLPLGKEHYKAEEVDESPANSSSSSDFIGPAPFLANEDTGEELESADGDAGNATVPLSHWREVRTELETETAGPPAAATILVVEDNDDIRQLLVTLFSPFYHTLTAVDGREALEIVRDELPDIVLSDVLMPHMSGTELCKAIKQDFSICHIPVVLLTARTAAEQALEGLKIGADDYITKPFNNDLLVSRCNNLVNSRRMLQRKFGEHPHTAADMLGTNPLDKEMLDRAMKIIDKYYMDSKFSVDTFAREIGMSRTALFTKWKNLTGQPPKEFIMNMRLRKAADMLRNHPEISIAEVSYRNGFSSPRYFCKCFKDAYQQQPSTYRNGESDEDVTG